MDYSIDILCQKNVRPSDIAKICGMNIKRVRAYVKEKRKEYAAETERKRCIAKIMGIARIGEVAAEKVYEFCMGVAFAK
jgi:demethoxyubiquinone hydroxylase (CLK1/Coq7/Cat5 family)